MMLFALLIASLSVWDYPTGNPEEEKLRWVAPASVEAGGTVTLGGQNFCWSTNAGMMSAQLELKPAATNLPYAGFLYQNRDGGHSEPQLANFPGLSAIRFDQVGKKRGLDRNFPNALYPYPVFGNASVAFRDDAGTCRSLPRALMTVNCAYMAKMQKLYLANQVWAFPAVTDFPPAGTNGDQFASLSPYWLTCAGRSWSDQYYLRAALDIAATLPPETRQAAIDAGLLAPTVQAILRKSLKDLKTPEDYFTELAHPAALPANGLDWARMLARAQALKPEEIAPVATLKVAVAPPRNRSKLPENIYATRCASAFALHSRDGRRTFLLKVEGGDDSHVVQLNHVECEMQIVRQSGGVYRIGFEADKLCGRLDIAVFAKSATSDWGAPSYLTFYRPDPAAGTADPFLYPPAEED